MTDTGHPPELIWRPAAQRVAASRMVAFRDWLRTHAVVDVDDYDSLWRWSVAEPGEFWAAIAGFFDVAFHDRPTSVLPDTAMPGAQWFPGATLNYAEHALRPGEGKHDGEDAVVFRREDGLRKVLTYGKLRRQVAAARAGLVELGVGRGDRVAAFAPNSPDALVAFLATASLGAIWSSCSPDFGAHAAAERFSQIEPKVLITIDGYIYNGKIFDVAPVLQALRQQLPTLTATVVVPYLGTGSTTTADGDSAAPDGLVAWNELLDRHDGAALEFDPVPFDHPLWVLYSSGTTGLPKGIVHGHGGVTLEHLKTLALHFDLGPGDRFFWFTTTGWMMWNVLISGLLAGSTVVLYDGAPTHPDLGALWRMAVEEDLAVFGTSAPFVHACLKATRKGELTLDSAAYRDLRMVGSTGAPLSPDGFRWLGANLGADVQIGSFSGGTDLCTGFLGPAPDVPVWLGELSRPALGAAVSAFDEAGRPVVDEVGELVLTGPMPSMPVSFWNDPDGSKLWAAYFADIPGVWQHGDWITVTSRGSAVIHGRSDATINRGGVRMGTAELYRIIEAHSAVVDSLVVDTSATDEGELLCFVVLTSDTALDDVEPQLRESLRTALSPRHVPDRFLVVDDIPRTLNGKKCEIPVKKILAGVELERAVSRRALANPDALTPFLRLSGQMSRS